LRVDYSQYVLGLRLNLFVAAGPTLAGLLWFVYTQRRDRASHGSDRAPVAAPGVGRRWWVLRKDRGAQRGYLPVTASSATPVQTVEVFWRPGCPYCSTLRRALARKGVAATWRDIWDDEDARGFVRSVNGGCETVPTVRVGTTVLTNPSGAQVARAAGVAGGRSTAEGLSSGRNRAALRLVSWLPPAALVALSVVLDAHGDVGLSWAVDPFAVAAWWFTRPLRR